jgi:disulfide bond formation protein DsbB
MLFALYTPQVVIALSVLTVLGQIIALFLLGLLLFSVIGNKGDSAVANLVWRYGLLFSFIVALTAMGGSLFFSEIAGWNPCKDCWFQRIFLYPQTLLLLIALIRRDRGIAVSILTLSIIGAVFSVVQYVSQVQAYLHPLPLDPLRTCDASGVSCVSTQIFTFGYITIPLMALTASVLNALVALLLMHMKKRTLTIATTSAL